MAPSDDRTPHLFGVSGRQDLNLRPLDPQNLSSDVSARHDLGRTTNDVTFVQVEHDARQRVVPRWSQIRREARRDGGDGAVRRRQAVDLIVSDSLLRRSWPFPLDTSTRIDDRAVTDSEPFAVTDAMGASRDLATRGRLRSRPGRPSLR
jgi:hypothetical protein